MAKPQMLLWIDHEKARILSADGLVSRSVLAVPEDEEEPHKPNKPTASGRRGDHLHDRFFAAVTEALRGTGPLVLCGPSTAKLEFARYLERHARAISGEVVAVQTLDHPTDRQLAAFARNYFSPPPK